MKRLLRVEKPLFSSFQPLLVAFFRKHSVNICTLHKLMKEESRKLKKTDRLIIRGRSFRIREILDEGMGFFKAALLKEKDVTAHADQKTL